jgi:hypothetical protein
LRELVLLGFLYAGYTGSRTLASGEIGPARHHAARLLAVERWLNIDIEVWLNHLVSKVPPVAVAASYWYAVLHYLVTPTVLIWLYRGGRPLYARARNALILTTAIGLVSYLVLPTAPPRLMSGAYVDTLARESHYGWWTSHASAPAGLGGLTNELAAMPSLHVGWAVWAAWIVWRTSTRTYRLLGVAYPVVTSVVVVGTGNHWTLDVLAGAAVAAVGIAVTTPTRLSPSFSPRRRPRTNIARPRGQQVC